jgi:hypothetical protein
MVQAQRQITHTMAVTSNASRDGTEGSRKTSRAAGIPKTMVATEATNADTTAAAQEAVLRIGSLAFFEDRRK